MYIVPEDTEVLILGDYTLVHGFCFFKLFPIGCIGLKEESLPWEGGRGKGELPARASTPLYEIMFSLLFDF